MTKEQEVIERLNKDKNHPLACGDITIVNVEDIETVLSMLKHNSAEIEQKNTELAEKNAEIEKLKQILARNTAGNVISIMKETVKSKEDLEMLSKGWQIELEKKDKQIDLMAEFIKNSVSEKKLINEICIKGKCNNEECHEDDWKECIKQYFERKSEE